VRISPSVIIFDYGNVLCQAQPGADTEAMASILNLPMPRFTELYWQFRVPYDAGALEPDAYWNQLAKTELTADQIAELTDIDGRSWSHPAPVMPQWARDVRAAGLRTGLLSNMPASVRDYVLRCSWMPAFDSLTFSCDIGVCKPEAEIYRECLRALGVAPSEALFLDDREANVRGAQAVGLHAILFTDPDSATRHIERDFALPVHPDL
jgi:putative hydrolase of the HAD superfamily